MSDINIIDGFRPNYGNICVGEVKFFADMVNLIFGAEIFCGYVLGEGEQVFEDFDQICMLSLLIYHCEKKCGFQNLLNPHPRHQQKSMPLILRAAEC